MDLMTRKKIAQEAAKRYGKATKNACWTSSTLLPATTAPMTPRCCVGGAFQKAKPARALKPVATARRGRKPFYGAEVMKALAHHDSLH